MKYKTFLLFLCSCSFLVVLMEGKKNGKADRKSTMRDDFLLKQKLHALKELSQKASKKLADLTDYSTFYTTHLKNILRVRVPGTVGHREVKQFIVGKLKEYGWTVEEDEFTDNTPLGIKTFTNIIATLNPDADRRLALAAHYDSKLLTPLNGKYFIAATDSAVPCAMLLDFAKLLKQKMDDKKRKSQIENDVSPMLLFLDGEEAFEEWTPADSIYGSRHLAEVFENRDHHKSLLAGSVKMLDALDAFVLFDLIGYKNPQFLDLYGETSQLYGRLQRIERDMNRSGIIDIDRPYFPGRPYQPLSVEDDHVPFKRKGVPILHLISIPFPKVWHTLDDDEAVLDARSIEHLLKIFRQFLLEYFHL